MRISDTFAKRLLEVRGNMSQAEFAQRLGVSRGSIGLYEQGKRLPDIEVLRNIAEQFNVSCDWLVGLTDTKVIEPDIKAACEVTGLSECATSYLSIVKYNAPQYLEFIDKLLSYEFERSIGAEKTERQESSDVPLTPILGLFFYCDFWANNWDKVESILSDYGEEIISSTGNRNGIDLKKIDRVIVADHMLNEIKAALNTFSKTYYKGGVDAYANDNEKE